MLIDIAGGAKTNRQLGSQIRDMKSKVSVTHNHEQESANGGHLELHGRENFCNSETSDGGIRVGIADRGSDREPGELSSESGSEDMVDSEAKKYLSDVVKVEGQAPAEKKRKFSPIVWDRDDKEVSSTSWSRTSRLVEEQVTQQAVLKSCLNNSNPDNGGHKSPVKCNGIQNSSTSPIRKSPNDHVHDYLVDMTSSPTNDRKLTDDLEQKKMLDEDLLSTRNISSSRWVSESSSPVDEGEILEDSESPKKRNKVSYPDSVASRRWLKSSSMELMNQKDESIERDKGNSAESGEHGNCTRSLSGDDYDANDYENENHINVDENLDRNDYVDSDSEEPHKEAEETGIIPRTVNMLSGCRSVNDFERLNKIDEGTYGVVYRAKDKKTGDIVALKKVKMEKEREGFPLTSLREINILLSFHHPSIVDVKEVVVGSNLDSIFMVMEYMEHDLKGLMESMKQPFSQSEVKCLMLQLLAGVKYLHDNWVLHRDLKTSNLLLNNRGELKICDFGLARQYSSPLKPYTQLVVTLWYRAPELLLGTKQYSTAIDMWSLGCIMAELLSKEPLFNGKTEFDQLDKIFRILGTPNETIWPGFSKLPGVKINFVKHQYNMLRKKFPATSFTGSPVLSDSGFDLLNRLLSYDPEKRITAEAALEHEWFREVPLPKSKEFMPTFPPQHAQDRRLRRVLKSPDPLEEQRGKELRGDFGTGGIFG